MLVSSPIDGKNSRFRWVFSAGPENRSKIDPNLEIAVVRIVHLSVFDRPAAAGFGAVLGPVVGVICATRDRFCGPT